MHYTELKQKSADELKKVLVDTREALRKARFSVSQKQLKNVRSMRDSKKCIARVLTIMKNMAPRT